MKHSASSGERQSQFQNGHSDALYGAQQPALRRTQILMLGLRRSGKSSIQQVLFNNMPPLHTFHLEPTRRIIKVQYDSIIPLEIWDCPGNLTPDTLDAPLSHFSSMIFVIDIRDLYNQAITRLVDWLVASINQNPNMNFEVFVHKTERLPEDDKMENFRQIHERVSDRLAEIGPPYDAYNLNFQFTSVYDHTIHEAFSRVLHKLINSLPYLEDLLNVFCANSLASKAFLFDIKSRLHVATDASPVDALTHGLCCDWLTMLNQFGDLYKLSPKSSEPHTSDTAKDTPSSEDAPSQDEEFSYPCAATSIFPIPPGTTLTYHVITPHLALLSMLPTEQVWEARRGLVEYNVVFFREGVREIWEVEKAARGEVA